MKTTTIFLSLIVFLISGCSSGLDESPSLAKKYTDYFPIGAAVSGGHLADYDTVLLKKHFSSVTAENDMKPQRTIKAAGEYTFDAGDRIVEFALDNDMLVRGHVLVWHNQTPDWFFKDNEGIFLSKEAMFEREKQYIKDVLDHYKGKIYAWDVVNEAISDKKGKFYRDDTHWFRICGPEFIEKAFVYAREVDPDIKLFYNDYNLINPDKAQKVYEMAKAFIEKGIPIDGIGMQGHWTLEDVNAENLARSIDLFASLGLEVQITELDLSIYPFYHNQARDSLPAEVIEFTEDIETQQAEKYGEIFRVLREKSDKITNVTFWGVA
ncbi:MAG: endo-1,4-beta-xylanase, partial [Bacteroidota bacterium]